VESDYTSFTRHSFFAEEPAREAPEH
jgi:hypothetical protein